MKKIIFTLAAVGTGTMGAPATLVFTEQLSEPDVMRALYTQE